MDIVTSLSAYITQLGDEEFATRYGIKVRTAASWRRHERCPRPEEAKRLVEKSSGELTMDIIYAKAAA
jgi:hypothetical protein